MRPFLGRIVTVILCAFQIPHSFGLYHQTSLPRALPQTIMWQSTAEIRDSIRDYLHALRKEVDAAIKAGGWDWHFGMALESTSGYLKDKGIEEVIVATGNLDLMNGSGFRSFLPWRKPDEKTDEYTIRFWERSKPMKDPFDALSEKAFALKDELRVWEMNLGFLIVREGDILILQSACTSDTIEDGSSGIGIIESKAYARLHNVRVMLVNPPRPDMWPNEGSADERTRKLSAMTHETWRDKESADGYLATNPSERSILRSGIALQDVLSHMQHGLSLPSDKGSLAMVSKAKNKLSGGSSVGVALSRLKGVRYQGDDELLEGSILFGYTETGQDLNVLMLVPHFSLEEQSSVAEAKSMLAHSLPSYLSDTTGEGRLGAKDLNTRVGWMLDNLIHYAEMASGNTSNSHKMRHPSRIDI